GGGRGLGCKGSNITTDRNDNCNPPVDEISGQYSEPVVMSLCPAVFDRHVTTFNKTGVIQPLSNDCEQECIGCPRTAAQDSDNRKLLLAERCAGKASSSAAQEGENVAPSHSITTSAWASGGSSMPGIRAALARIAGYR